MSRIKPSTMLLAFLLPMATDVAGYKLYHRDVNSPDNPGGPLNYDDASVNVPLEAVTVTEDENGARRGEFDITDLDWSGGGLPNDSMILFGLSAVDDVGNESDIVQLGEPVPFDQEAPDAPTELQLVRL